MKLDYYKRYIDEFVRNNRRIMTKIPTANSYHRFEIYKYCDSLGLKHEKIQNGTTRKKLICPRCREGRVICGSCPWDDYEQQFRCFGCKYVYTGYFRYDLFTGHQLIDFIQISK